MKRLYLKINGIHCKNCKELIEGEINVLKGIYKINLNLETNKATVEYNDQEISGHEIIREIEGLNYEVQKISESEKSGKNEKGLIETQKRKFLKNVMTAGIVLLTLGVLYFLVSRFGFLEILGRLNESNLSYPLIFIIGLLASFHCISMCGGIVIAYTSRFCASVKGNKTVSLPHFYYNLGRILSYALTGAILGGIGSFFGINKNFTGIITLFAGFFMIAVGFSLIIRHALLDKITGILPVSLTRLFSGQLHALYRNNKERTIRLKVPLIIGFLNGFIPCGPLQALQIYALSSGSASKGGLSMLIFGLGTVPLMLGFGNIISIFSWSRLKQTMKVSGVIVILLGIITLNRGYNSFFNDNSDSQNYNTETSAKPAGISLDNNGLNKNYQTVSMDIAYQGYVPDTITVKKRIPVRWVINGKQISNCTSEILFPAFGIDKKLKQGENIIEFTPKVAGTYKFSCGMRMVWGKFIVTE